MGREGNIAKSAGIATRERRGNPTIFALASGAVPAGIGVVRVSGPGARVALELAAGGVPPARRASLRALRDPMGGALLDRALVVFFPAGSSFTGEDVAEFHLHGGRAVVAAVLAVLGRMEGFRLAEPGEFTRRAFVNGRLDLTAVEGLADLITAETEAQRRLALRQADGGLRRLCEGWRERLIRARALVEAELDFPDEEDVPRSEGMPRRGEVEALVRDMRGSLAEADYGERVRDGFEVVILGRPNAGKSSLLNALARRDVAIVTPEPGTTRDLVEVRLDLGGYAVNLVDTAGLRETNSAVEREGMRRASERASAADVVLWLADCTGPPEPGPAGAVRIGTKCDLVPGEKPDAWRGRFDHCVSARTGEGLGPLVKLLGDAAREGQGSEGALLSRARHRQHVERSVEALERALRSGVALELVAEELRGAADEIGRLTGSVGVEVLLDVIFGEFCIGK